LDGLADNVVLLARRLVGIMSRITFKSAPGVASMPLRGQDLLVTGAIFLFGAWGSWFMYHQRDLLDWWKDDFASDTSVLGSALLVAASGSSSR
jgi:hypothetical protein